MRKLIGATIFVVAALLVPASTQALDIVPTDAFLQDQAPTTTSQSEIYDEIEALDPTLDINAGTIIDDIDGSENPNQTVDLTGGQYLLVKDGNSFPAWYLFDLADLGWTGPGEEINLIGFWGDKGAISHVSSFGTFTSSPDGGTTLSLLGLGMLGLGYLKRRFVA